MNASQEAVLAALRAHKVMCHPVGGSFVQVHNQGVLTIAEAAVLASELDRRAEEDSDALANDFMALFGEQLEVIDALAAQLEICHAALRNSVRTINVMGINAPHELHEAITGCVPVLQRARQLVPPMASESGEVSLG